jgi:hypothetical protein
MACVDQHQSNADRRRFQKIAFVFAVGLITVAVSAAVTLWVPIEDQPGGRGAPVLGIPIGVIFMGVALIDLMKRLRSGPTKPGKRARS